MCCRKWGLCAAFRSRSGVLMHSPSPIAHLKGNYCMHIHTYVEFRRWGKQIGNHTCCFPLQSSTLISNSLRLTARLILGWVRTDRNHPKGGASKVYWSRWDLLWSKRAPGCVSCLPFSRNLKPSHLRCILSLHQQLSPTSCHTNVVNEEDISDSSPHSPGTAEPYHPWRSWAFFLLQPRTSLVFTVGTLALLGASSWNRVVLKSSAF